MLNLRVESRLLTERDWTIYIIHLDEEPSIPIKENFEKIKFTKNGCFEVFVNKCKDLLNGDNYCTDIDHYLHRRLSMNTFWTTNKSLADRICKDWNDRRAKSNGWF